MSYIGNAVRAAAACAVALLAAVPSGSAAAGPVAPSAATDRVADPDRQLGPGWAVSRDRAVTVSGDATGLHVLTADEAAGYAWRTAATLAEPGVATDQWIGQACVTGSGQRAVVVYAPRQIVNDDTLFRQGALAAVVDLPTGRVTRLPEPVSIAYHDPGCGTGEKAVLSRSAGDSTTLLAVDTERGAITGRVTLGGQATSAVPYGDGIAAAKGDKVLAVATGGATRALATTSGTAAWLAPDAEGGLAYQVPSDHAAEVHRYAAGKDTLLGTGAPGAVRVHATGGQVFLTGPDAAGVAARAALPDSWRALDVPADADISTTGALAVISATNHHEAAGPSGSAGAPPVSLSAKANATGSALGFRVQPTPPRADGTGTPPASPAQPTPPRPAGPAAPRADATGTPPADPATVTTDPDRGCAVPRNDPRIQSLQPSAAMAEWAADLAVQGGLTTLRTPGWNGSSLPAYRPQALFPPHPLAGGGRVPAQILLGVLAQESNLQQATKLTVPGESGNFISGGFYGATGNYRLIDWSKVDCGHGIAQVTSGMKRGDTTFSPVQQTALTVDYAANIAAGLQILQDKWNQLAQAGVVANNGDPRYLENWFFALWAYNSGFHEKGTDPSAPHGLGWANNPANPDFPPDRKMFLAGPDDARTPNKWSYAERVMGWAAHSQPKTDPVTGTTKPAFATGSWSGDPQAAQPPLGQFCTPAANQCDPAHPHQPAGFPTEPASPCQRDDLQCWWHTPTMWTNCAQSCGTEVLTYHPGDREPPVTPPFDVPCALPAAPPYGTTVVDDVGNDVHYGLGDTRPCGYTKNWTSHGTLSFSFGSAVQNGVTVHPSKVDFHQFGTGFGRHFWLAYVYPDSDPDMRVTGTWTPELRGPGRYRIQVHVPPQRTVAKVTYVVHPGVDGKGMAQAPIPVTVDQNAAKGWVQLTDTQLYPGASVELTNLSDDPHADGSAGFGFDAMTFAPLG